MERQFASKRADFILSDRRTECKNHYLHVTQIRRIWTFMMIEMALEKFKEN